MNKYYYFFYFFSHSSHFHMWLMVIKLLCFTKIISYLQVNNFRDSHSPFVIHRCKANES